MDDLDLNTVASFLMLAEEEHYGWAAQRLNLTASALTKRIQRLERQVGAVLLVRDASGVTGLTAAGMRFAREAGPLLAHARAAAAAARVDRRLLTVRLGVLGRIGEWPDRRQLAQVARQFTRRHPDVRLVCRPVPYPAMHRCLLEGAVDVVWGTAAAAPAKLTVSPLGAAERIALVAASHELADKPEAHAADLVDLPMLYTPGAPVDWMSPFYLGDVRPARDARLVEVDGTDGASVLNHVKLGGAVTTTTDPFTSGLAPSLRAVRLVGLPPVQFYAARRRADRREPVMTLVDILPGIAAAGAATSADAVSRMSGPGNSPDA
jgi:DNA-binding transcriptional LysR family regulator